MKRCICLLVLAALLCPLYVHAEDKPDQQAMMKAYMEKIQPGPAHQKLAGLAGTWNFTMTSFEDPKNPMSSTGTCTSAMVMDGRYLQDTATGSMMGMTFNGSGYTGFNNITKQYESTWIDNMGTGIMMGTGKETDPSTITMNWTYADPMTGKVTKVKTITKIVDANNHTFTWYNQGGGKEVKTMEIAYVRSGS
jgi:uncharacterized protein DUF1579